jgi:hypothetical protein
MLINLLIIFYFFNNVFFYIDDISYFYIFKTMLYLFCLNYKAIRDYIVIRYVLCRCMFLYLDMIYLFILQCKLNMVYYCINYIKNKEKTLETHTISKSSKFKTEQDVEDFLNSCS